MHEISRKRLETLAAGFMPARVVLTAVEVGVFLALGKEALAAGELARRTKTKPAPLARLLNALVALKLLEKRRGAYRATPEARRHLVAGAPDFLGDIMLHRASMWDTWGHLTSIVRTGVVPARTFDRERERRFIRGMADVSRHAARGTARALRRELQAADRLLDVGGGPATYACAFARAAPGLAITVLDLPGPLRYARETVRRENLGGRIRFRPADAVTAASFGADYDLVFMSNLIHSFTARVVRALIAKATEALRPGGMLAVKDFYIEREGTDPPFAALFSINMLVGDAGDCYARDEVRAWMAEAGVRPERSIELDETSSIIVGRKA